MILFSAQPFLTLHGGNQGDLWALGTCYHDPMGRKGQTRLPGVQDTAVALLCCSYLSRNITSSNGDSLADSPTCSLTPAQHTVSLDISLPQSLPSRVTWGKGLMTSLLCVPCFVG